MSAADDQEWELDLSACDLRAQRYGAKIPLQRGRYSFEFDAIESRLSPLVVRRARKDSNLRLANSGSPPGNPRWPLGLNLDQVPVGGVLRRVK